MFPPPVNKHVAQVGPLCGGASNVQRASERSFPLSAYIIRQRKQTRTGMKSVKLSLLYLHLSRNLHSNLSLMYLSGERKSVCSLQLSGMKSQASTHLESEWHSELQCLLFLQPSLEGTTLEYDLAAAVGVSPAENCVMSDYSAWFV